MERLTEWTGEEWIAVQKRVPAPGKKHGKIIGSRDCMARLAAYENTGLEPEEIMAGELLTGWIPVEEQLPLEPEDGKVDFDDLEDYIVMIDGAQRPTFLAYAGGSEWYRDGTFYRARAWMPLPEPYEP